MTSSINGSTPVSQSYSQQSQQTKQAQQPAKTKQQEPQDTVQLSKQAQGTGDVDHDGDHT
jgi:hypothetical protein